MFSDSQKVINHIVSWLENYCKTNKAKGFVVGVSGGIDSALTSTLAAKTKLPTMVFSLPIHQSKKTLILAENHLSWLKKYPNITTHTVDISKSFNTISSTLENSLPSSQKQTDKTLAQANLRARLRMCSLYYFAGLNNFLVCGTGNKIEDFEIGFFTKYGDGGVDISPIADLLKSEVKELAQVLNIIPEIITANPTDGLWEDDKKTDEVQIGASYPELEWAIAYQQKKGVSKTLSKRQKKVLNILQERREKNQHKVNPIPICKIPITIK